MDHGLCTYMYSVCITLSLGYTCHVMVCTSHVMGYCKLWDSVYMCMCKYLHVTVPVFITTGQVWCGACSHVSQDLWLQEWSAVPLWESSTVSIVTMCNIAQVFWLLCIRLHVCVYMLYHGHQCCIGFTCIWPRHLGLMALGLGHKSNLAQVHVI